MWRPYEDISDYARMDGGYGSSVNLISEGTFADGDEGWKQFARMSFLCRSNDNPATADAVLCVI